jgi:hypothetical protein
MLPQQYSLNWWVLLVLISIVVGYLVEQVGE